VRDLHGWGDHQPEPSVAPLRVTVEVKRTQEVDGLRYRASLEHIAGADVVSYTEGSAARRRGGPCDRGPKPPVGVLERSTSTRVAQEPGRPLRLHKKMSRYRGWAG